MTPCDAAHLGFSLHGISQTRILEWTDISYSRGSSRPRDQTHICGIKRQILYHWKTWEALRKSCCCSGAKSCLSLCNPTDCNVPAPLSFTVSWGLLKLMSIESVMPSNHLILCHPSPPPKKLIHSKMVHLSIPVAAGVS